MTESEMRFRKGYPAVNTEDDYQAEDVAKGLSADSFKVSSFSQTSFSGTSEGGQSYGQSQNGWKTSSQMQLRLNEQRMKNKAEKLKADVMEQFDVQLHDMLGDLLQEMEQTVNPHRQSSTASHQKKTPNGVLPDKEFFSRPSVLTELLEINHIQTIYHIFVAILIVFSLNTIIYDLIDKGRFGLDFDLIIWSFGKLPIVMVIWSAMIGSTLLIVYPLFYYWSVYRRPGRITWIDYCGLALYISYQLAFLVLPITSLHAHMLPPASSLIIVTEQVRLVMKSHAFVRANIPLALNSRSDGDNSEDVPHESDAWTFPDFTKYLYFLFAPTLIYRDSYPRTTWIRWRYVVSNLVQLLASIFYIFYIFERFCVPAFRDFSEGHLAPRRLILSTFGSVLPATLVLFIVFFAILHSWLNAFAEMLRFADRLFYKDWWNSSSFSSYYRTWNVVVHDWLYMYIYRDLFMVFGSPCRRYAMAAVFLISAVFHEYILTIVFGFFYPVLFIMFAGAGFFFTFFTSKNAPRRGNIFMWVALFMGNGLLMCMYSLEWYARISCPVNKNAILDYVVPRSWTCDFSALVHPT